MNVYNFTLGICNSYFIKINCEGVDIKGAYNHSRQSPFWKKKRKKESPHRRCIKPVLPTPMLKQVYKQMPYM